jgi:ABC-type polysaccharide/polyol phosphate transport system ATPase subunit
VANDILIEAEGLSKAYRMWRSPSGRLATPLLETAAGMFPKASAPHQALARRAARGCKDFYALRDLSFTIRRGEATGIIGRNGSGKSTLLQLIAGTLTPTTGSIEVNGRVSALLELGSGFNPDFSGRENVFLNGAIYGLTHAEVAAKLEEIVAFADIGDFLDQPVKTYSSGMMMRLAFAVAVNVQPDVLIIDEALSVGDVFFSQKCFQRIREIVHRGATLIFVSHDTAAVQSLCDRALLLNQGRLIYDGAPEDCVSRYFNLHDPKDDTGASVSGSHPAVDQAARQAVLAADVLPAAKARHGDRTLEITAAAVVDGHGAPTWDFEMMHRAGVRLLVRANGAVRRPSVGLQLHDRMGNLVFAAGTPQLRFTLPAMAAGEEILLEFRVALNLQPGAYTLSLDSAEFDAENPNIGTFHDRVGGLGPLTITHVAPGAMPFYGIAQLPMEISYL